MSSRIWLPESATEWIASASIDEKPVRKNARNFVTAIPRFASNAATTAAVPPSVDMVAILGCRHRRGRPAPRASPGVGEPGRTGAGSAQQLGLRRGELLVGEHTLAVQGTEPLERGDHVVTRRRWWGCLRRLGGCSLLRCRLLLHGGLLLVGGLGIGGLLLVGGLGIGGLLRGRLLPVAHAAAHRGGGARDDRRARHR